MCWLLVNYEFVDNSPLHNKVSYYRLNQTDFDGSSKYSKIITLNPHKIDGFEISNLYPNPTENQFTFSVLGETDKLSTLKVGIYNSRGEYLKRISYTDLNYQSKFTVGVADLDNGVYFVHINAEDKRIVKKLTILR